MRKKNIWKLLIGGAAVSLAIGVFITAKTQIPNPNTYMDRVNHIEGHGMASWMYSASSADELTEKADLIVEGKVVDYEPIISGGIVATEEMVEVKKVLKGDISKGEKITVVVTGGEKDGMKTPTIQDCPIMDMRGNYMLFLKTDNEGKSYYIIAGNQGFGLINNNKIEVTDQNKVGKEFGQYNVDELEKDIIKKYHTKEEN